MIPELMEMRRKDPQDDLLTGLVHAEIEEDDGTTRTLTLEEILAFMQLISSAGTETVARLLGFGVVTLAALPGPAPAAPRRPVADEQRGRGAHALRGAVAHAVALGRAGHRVPRHHHPRGSKISLLNGAADRDERHFPNPDVFDVRRDIDRQLAFGYGAHFCIGAALARMETRVALAETLQALPELRDRRVTPRVRAHRDRARLQVGADEGAVSRSHLHVHHLAGRAARGRDRRGRHRRRPRRSRRRHRRRDPRDLARAPRGVLPRPGASTPTRSSRSRAGSANRCGTRS